MKQVYTNHTKRLLAEMPREQAMSLAVGGSFDVIGQTEVEILRYYGLQPHQHLIDVGCGSGRLAKPLSAHHHGKYSGFDIVSELVDYAREIVRRPDWRFEIIDKISIPETDRCADMVCFFSVFTHLLHEQSYWYLEESIRVLKPGGKIIFSFLEFREPDHWPIFMGTLEHTKGPANAPINVFISREEIEVWAKRLRLKIEAFHDAMDNVWRVGPLGQSLCVLSTTEKSTSSVLASRINIDLACIEQFCGKNKKIYIYGAGKYAAMCMNILREEISQFMGYIVSDGRKAENRSIADPVFELSEITPRDDEGIIVALNRANEQEVLPELKKRGFKNFISFLG